MNLWSTSRPCKYIGAIFPSPRHKLSGIVQWIVHHKAVATSRCSIAHSIGITAVIETHLVLANIPKITLRRRKRGIYYAQNNPQLKQNMSYRHAHATRYRIFNRAPPIERTIRFTIFGAAIITYIITSCYQNAPMRESKHERNVIIYSYEIVNHHIYDTYERRSTLSSSKTITYSIAFPRIGLRTRKLNPNKN